MKLHASLTSAVLLAGLHASTAQAAIIIDFTESGGNTTATFSGSFNLNAAGAFALTNASGDFIVSDFVGFGYIAIPGVNQDLYELDTSPAAFGTGGFIPGVWSSVVGDFVSFYSNPRLGVPTGYVSGAPINGSAVAVGRDFTDLGLISGTSFLTTFTNGPTTDTVTFNIGPASVIPEPSTYIAGAGLLGLAGFVFLRARRKKAAPAE